MTPQPQQPAPPVFVDLPDVLEIFTDSTQLINFDQHTFRIVFTVTRPDIVPGKQVTMKQYPCARIVMPAAVGVELVDKLRQLVDMMIKQGALKPITPPPPVSTKPN